MSAGKKPKATILVIDDEQIVHESVRRVLEDAGYAVDSALRVDQALSMVSESSYDVVLTDLMVPDRSGMDAVEVIVRDHPDTGVVMFTGFATVDSAIKSMKLGALDYLPKPFTPAELLQVVERALAKTIKARRDREIERTYATAEKAIKSSLDLKELLNLIGASVVGLLKVKGSAVFLYKKAEEALELASSYGLSDEYLQKGGLLSEKSISAVLNSVKPIVVQQEDFDKELQYPAEARKEGIAGIMSVPLTINGTVIGVLRIYSADRLSLTDEETDLLLRFSEQAARALENAMAYERVKEDIEGIKRGIPGPVRKRIQEA